VAYLEKQREFSKKAHSNKRKHARRRQLELLDKQRNNPKAFWNFIKNLGNTSSTNYYLPGSVESKSGEVVHDPSSVKEEWNNHLLLGIC